MCNNTTKILKMHFLRMKIKIHTFTVRRRDQKEIELFPVMINTREPVVPEV